MTSDGIRNLIQTRNPRRRIGRFGGSWGGGRSPLIGGMDGFGGIGGIGSLGGGLGGMTRPRRRTFFGMV